MKRSNNKYFIIEINDIDKLLLINCIIDKEKFKFDIYIILL